MTSSEKAGLAAISGAWNTLPERPKPATAVRMGGAVEMRFGGHGSTLPARPTLPQARQQSRRPSPTE